MVTAGNASGMNDAASGVILMKKKAKELGVPVLARIVSTATTGVEPEYMGIGPVSASKKALEKAGLTIEDMDLFEINEAFAAQAVACARELGIDQEKLNVNGSGISRTSGRSNRKQTGDHTDVRAEKEDRNTDWQHCAQAAEWYSKSH